MGFAEQKLDRGRELPVANSGVERREADLQEAGSRRATDVTATPWGRIDLAQASTAYTCQSCALM